MLIYHGSNNIIKKPIYGFGKKYNDYGIGFYCTEHENLAAEWAVDKDNDGYVNCYEFDLKSMNVLDLSGKEYIIMHWLGILLKNRVFDVTTPIEREALKYIDERFAISINDVDVIIGYRADDSYFSYARDFISGTISYEQLCKAIYLGDLGMQICIKSKYAFDNLRYIQAKHVSSDEWYSSKQLREFNARAGYRDMEKETYHKGELYISRMIDEELGVDDLRLRQGLS
ncbi:MAG: DUF3990 domain-containing protein [Lachnospira sp.]